MCLSTWNRFREAGFGARVVPILVTSREPDRFRSLGFCLRFLLNCMSASLGKNLPRLWSRCFAFLRSIYFATIDCLRRFVSSWFYVTRKNITFASCDCEGCSNGNIPVLRSAFECVRGSAISPLRVKVTFAVDLASSNARVVGVGSFQSNKICTKTLPTLRLSSATCLCCWFVSFVVLREIQTITTRYFSNARVFHVEMSSHGAASSPAMTPGALVARWRPWQTAVGPFPLYRCQVWLFTSSDAPFLYVCVCACVFCAGRSSASFAHSIQAKTCSKGFPTWGTRTPGVHFFYLKGYIYGSASFWTFYF